MRGVSGVGGEALAEELLSLSFVMPSPVFELDGLEDIVVASS